MLKKQRIFPVIAAVESEAPPRLEKAAGEFRWFQPGSLSGVVSFFRESGVREVVMLGKVRASTVFRPENLDARAWKTLQGLPDKSTLSLLGAAVAFLEGAGLQVLSPLSVLGSQFCREGILSAVEPTPGQLADMDFGLALARRFADLDIGQTLIVKDRAVVSVEGMEGTDEAIRRGGRLAGPGFVAVKAGRTSQDMRLDIPAVGLYTIRSLVRAGGGALGLDAARVAFFQQAEALALADAHGIAIAVRKIS
jgi:DUF1009 family protein